MSKSNDLTPVHFLFYCLTHLFLIGCSQPNTSKGDIEVVLSLKRGIYVISGFLFNALGVDIPAFPGQKREITSMSTDWWPILISWDYC